MAFHETRFPASLSRGSVGGPERRTEIVELANGFEERNTPWAQSRRRYDAGMGLRSLDDVADMISFFEEREGQLHGFRWKDWADYKSCKPSAEVDAQDQLIGQGDEHLTSFQLIKSYGGYERVITKPVSGTVRVAIDGVHRQEGLDWTVDLTTGVVTFVHPPEPQSRITAGFEFDVPVRFDTPQIVTSVTNFQAGEVPDVPVIEVRV